MNVVVLIKQVPDTTDVRIDRETNTLIREGVPSIINPFDMYAIEEALRVREGAGEGTVTVMSMGPPQVDAALREAIALGVDRAVLLSDRAFAGSDTWSTSYTLAAGIRKLEDYDLILCGKQAIDGDTAQVGPGVAQFLGVPQVTYARKLTIDDGSSATVERMLEDGYDVVKVPPAEKLERDAVDLSRPLLRDHPHALEVVQGDGLTVRLAQYDRVELARLHAGAAERAVVLYDGDAVDHLDRVVEAGLDAQPAAHT